MPRKTKENKEFISLSKARRNIEESARKLNTYYKDFRFGFEDKEDKKILKFGDFEIYSLNNDNKEFVKDNLNTHSIFNEAKDKINSLIFHKKLDPFPPRKNDQKVIINNGALKGEKGVITDFLPSEDYSLVFVDGHGEIELFKKIISVI